MKSIVGKCKYNGFEVFFKSSKEAGRNGFEASHISRNVNKGMTYYQRGYNWRLAEDEDLIRFKNKPFSIIDINNNRKKYLSGYRKIKGFSSYFINRCGKIYSLKLDRFMSPHKSRHGYLHTVLVDDYGVSKNCDVHRLVAKNFIPNPDNLLQVNHKDENKENNDINNLEWVSAKENINYGTRNNRVANKVSKSLSKPVISISKCGVMRYFKSAKEAAETLGVYQTHISDVIYGKAKQTGGYKFMFATEAVQLAVEDE